MVESLKMEKDLHFEHYMLLEVNLQLEDNHYLEGEIQMEALLSSTSYTFQIRLRLRYANIVYINKIYSSK